jgi:tetratricopeptide (TPR) repeat protein
MEKDNVVDFDVDWEDLHNTPQWKSDDLLEEAYYCKDEKEKRKLLKEALKINPDNIDAQLALADFEDSPIKRLKKYEGIVENATKLLENKNMFDKENIGIFWGIIGTRPYMRARHRKLLTLIDLGRYTEACKEAEDMIRLCESDNLGVRYILLPLYCILEKFDEC